MIVYCIHIHNGLALMKRTEAKISLTCRYDFSAFTMNGCVFPINARPRFHFEVQTPILSVALRFCPADFLTNKHITIVVGH